MAGFGGGGGRRGNPFLRGAGLALSTIGELIQSDKDEEERLRLIEEERQRRTEADLTGQVETGIGAQNREQLAGGQVALQRLLQEQGVERIPEETFDSTVTQDVTGPDGFAEQISAEFQASTPDFVPTVEQNTLQNALTTRERKFEVQESGDLQAAAINLLKQLTPGSEGDSQEDAVTAVALAANQLGLDLSNEQIKQMANEILPEAERARQVFDRGEDAAAAATATQEFTTGQQGRQLAEDVRTDLDRPAAEAARDTQRGIQRQTLESMEKSNEGPFATRENRQQLLAQSGFLRLLDSSKVEAFENMEIGLSEALAGTESGLERMIVDSVIATNERRMNLFGTAMTPPEIGAHIDFMRETIGQARQAVRGASSDPNVQVQGGQPTELFDREEAMRVLLKAMPDPITNLPINILTPAEEALLKTIPEDVRQSFFQRMMNPEEGPPTGKFQIDPSTLR